MRIISGSHRGRRVNAPTNLPVRPTTDVAKESIFNIINNYFDIEDLSVLDLFAGIGSISLEFASRGAHTITSVDKEFKCVRFIQKIADECAFDAIKVVRADVFKYLKYKHPRFDLIFADPPYEMEGVEDIPDLVFKNDMLSKDGWLIVEHSKTVDFSRKSHFRETRKYGKVHFSIFEYEQDN